MNGQPIIDIQMQRMVGVASDDPRPHFVYICRHANGAPMYVGISLDAEDRLAQHQYGSPWFSVIKHVEVEAHPNRRAALDREEELIKTLHPPCNTVHVDRLAAMKDAWHNQTTPEGCAQFLAYISAKPPATRLTMHWNRATDAERAEFRAYLSNLTPDQLRELGKRIDFGALMEAAK